MERSYYQAESSVFAAANRESILGALVESSPFDVAALQRDAWLYEIRHLQAVTEEISGGHIFLEFTIPRMGRRADAILLYRGIVFVLEYKVGDGEFSSAAIDQTTGYALDLKNFHEESHHLTIVPILIATTAQSVTPTLVRYADGVAAPLRCNAADLLRLVRLCVEKWSDKEIDPMAWVSGRYKPTPTIVEAAQALYRKHDVQEISRSEAGATNLTTTANYIDHVVDGAKAGGQKAICFLTGVPGSGKTLAGLTIANKRMNAPADEHAVFLSGNGPLVEVLREALAQDALSQARELGAGSSTRSIENRRAAAFIQNIHHFRDESLTSTRPPVEKIVVFDEAQRAWNAEQTSRFMREKRGQAGFDMSEPEFLLSVMNRHGDWCVVICLVGDGQEINTGEAGISEWLSCLQARFPGWDVHLSDTISTDNELAGSLVRAGRALTSSALHLSVSLRSFRAERVSEFVGAIVEGNASKARQVAATLDRYEVRITRDIAAARSWLREQRRGAERAGLLASSNALRLKPEGIFVKAKIDPPQWFLASRDDVRSCDALEDVGTEFDVQGLELDWACVLWDANFRRADNAWSFHSFKGTKWQSVGGEEKRRYLANAYRVLLTRARQGMVIFVPCGDDNDATRPRSFYDETYGFLNDCGMLPLP